MVVLVRNRKYVMESLIMLIVSLALRGWWFLFLFSLVVCDLLFKLAFPCLAVLVYRVNFTTLLLVLSRNDHLLTVYLHVHFYAFFSESK